jgi:dienelactone hydrolase
LPLFEFRLGRATPLVTAALAVAVVAFAMWHGPGLALALWPQPPVKAGNALAADVLDLSVIADASKLSPRTYEVRAFVSNGWRLGPNARTLPVVFYLPSWGSRPLENDVLLQGIASNGYLVLAVADVAHDPPEPGESAELRNGRVAQLDLYDANGVDRLIRAADLKADLAARKVTSLIDAIANTPSGPGSELWKRADLHRIAAIGFSVGGSSAAEALRSDHRVLAAVNIDGWSFGSTAGQAVDKPYLVFASTNSLPPVAFGTARRNTRAVERISRARERAQLALWRSRLIVIRGTLHGDYTDRLHGGDRWKEWRPWQPPLAKPAAVRERIDNAIRDFLASNVKIARSVGPATSPSLGR